MHEEDENFCVVRRDILAQAIQRSIFKLPGTLNFPSFKHPLIQLLFEGTKDSFKIACGNITANRKVREFGLKSIDIVLPKVCDLFEILQIDLADSFVLCHGDIAILEIKNNRKDKFCFKRIFLDYSEMIRKFNAIQTSAHMSAVNSKKDLASHSSNQSTFIYFRHITTMFCLTVSFFLIANAFGTRRNIHSKD